MYTMQVTFWCIHTRNVVASMSFAISANEEIDLMVSLILCIALHICVCVPVSFSSFESACKDFITT